MTGVRRRRRRTGSDRAALAELFLFGDGTVADFDAQRPLDRMGARAAWPSARSATWALWLECQGDRDPTCPPGGAVAYDGLGDVLARRRWPSHIHGATVADQRRENRAAAQAARADLKVLRAWMKANPVERAGSADAFGHHERALLTVVEIAGACSTVVEVDQALANVWWRSL